ncbi:MAG: hypothetical protein EXX96DRAFT_583356 [Benjaminiella poitrasii]|nr:MAG: hypothetical protein EXX96DRAFT_583356 [Benjaminiella poitrasii]
MNKKYMQTVNNNNKPHLVVPFGNIPKRKKRNNATKKSIEIKTENEKETYHRHSPSMASSFLSLLTAYFGIDHHCKSPKNNKHKLYLSSNGGGLLPRTPKRKTDASITPHTVTAAPITIMDVRLHDSEDCTGCYLSESSDSSDNSSTITNSSSSSNDGCSDNNDYSYSSIEPTIVHHRPSMSATTMSEILCDHYVQKTTNKKDVPLETYRVFEASKGDDVYDDESWFIWDNFQKTKEWIQIMGEAPKREEKRREISRVNSAYFRMIVAEVNMMRADKIVRPLRQRGSLPPRADLFDSSIPSPLRRYSTL